MLHKNELLWLTVHCEAFREVFITVFVCWLVTLFYMTQINVCKNTFF